MSEGFDPLSIEFRPKGTTETIEGKRFPEKSTETYFDKDICHGGFHGQGS